MNVDFRVKTSLFRHPKYKKLKRQSPESALALFALWAFVTENHPDGRIGRMDAEDLAIAADYDGDAGPWLQSMIAFGFIDRHDDGTLYIHDWEDHNPYAAAAPERQEQARKAANKRWGKHENETFSRADNTNEQCQSLPEQCSEHNSAMLTDANSNAPTKPTYPTKGYIPEKSPSETTGQAKPPNPKQVQEAAKADTVTDAGDSQDSSEGGQHEPPAVEKPPTPLHLFTLAFREQKGRDPVYRNRKTADTAASGMVKNIGRNRYGEVIAWFFSPQFKACRPWYCSDGFTWDSFSAHFDKVILALEAWEDAGSPADYPPPSERSQNPGNAGRPVNPYEFAPSGRRRTIQEQRIAEQQDQILQEAREEITRIYDGNPPPEALKAFGKGAPLSLPAPNGNPVSMRTLPIYADAIDADFKEIRH